MPLALDTSDARCQLAVQLRPRPRGMTLDSIRAAAAKDIARRYANARVRSVEPVALGGVGTAVRIVFDALTEDRVKPIVGDAFIFLKNGTHHELGSLGPAEPDGGPPVADPFSPAMPTFPSNLGRPPIAGAAATVPADFVERAGDAGGAAISAPADWRNATTADAAATVAAHGAADARFNVPDGCAAAIFTAIPARSEQACEVRVAGRVEAFGRRLRLIESRDVSVNGRATGRAVYDVTPAAGPTLRFVEYDVVDGEQRGLLGSQAAADDRFVELEPTLDRIAASIRLPPPPLERAIDATFAIRVPAAWQVAAAARSAAATRPARRAVPGPLPPTRIGEATRGASGVATLDAGESLATAARLRPPFAIRLGYEFRQMIFNWAMEPTVLRVDGGPIDGKHEPGAGALPRDAWTTIELSIASAEVVMRVDRVERYRAAGDFSRVDEPLTIVAHRGTLEVQSVELLP